ncbi:allantoate permease [Apiospora phragmitis]|uniref:Allantoate permease n=1 Tax=Apiospora phragmitis TaxID=2905665 RepID=A0ABR1X7F3_9PEZI
MDLLKLERGNPVRVCCCLQCMAIQSGNIIRNFIYRDEEKEMLHCSNRAMVAINAIAILLFFTAKADSIWRNKQRITEEESLHIGHKTPGWSSTRLSSCPLSGFLGRATPPTRQALAGIRWRHGR